MSEGSVRSGDSGSSTVVATTPRSSSQERSSVLTRIYGVAHHVPTERGSTRAHATIVEGGSLGVVTCGPGVVRRDNADIELDPRRSTRLQLVMSGRTVITQQDRELVLTPGQVGVYRSDTEYEMTVLEPSHLVTISLASTDGVAPSPEPNVSPTVEGGRILAMTLRAAAAEIGDLDAGAVGQLMAVIRLLTSDARGGHDLHGGRSPDEIIVSQAKGVIERNITSQELSPRWIAQQLYISVRRLHRAFEGEPLTVADHIIHERVTRCAADLARSRSESMPLSVGRVGAKWGILDASKFSRQFKKVTGHTPTEFRRLNSPPSIENAGDHA